MFGFLTFRNYLLQPAVQKNTLNLHLFDSHMETNSKTELVGEDMAEIETETWEKEIDKVCVGGGGNKKRQPSSSS